MTAIRRDSGTKTMSLDFCEGDILADLNRIHTSNGIGILHEDVEFKQLDFVLPFIAALAAREMGADHLHPMTCVYTNLFGLLHLINRQSVEDVLAP